MDSVGESAGNRYSVEAIRKKKIIRGKPWYYIKWLGYSEEDNSWEPLRNCNGALSMIREFEVNLKQEKRKKSATARTSKHSTNRERETDRQTDTCETNERLEGLNLNIENQSTVNEPAIPESSNPANKKLRRRSLSPAGLEEGRQNNRKSVRGGKVKSKGPYGRKVFANSNCNVSANRRDLENIPPQRNTRFDDSFSDLNTVSTCQTPASTETDSTTTSNEEYTLEKLKKCSVSEIEIVGAEPSEEGVTIGVRGLNDNNVFRLDSKEVTELWAQAYVSFLESHIRFDDSL